MVLLFVVDACPEYLVEPVFLGVGEPSLVFLSAKLTELRHIDSVSVKER